ncbi:AB hydrolase superfamily protein B1A11.02 [Cyphellophora attinorum]|uniref:AB hydrolase superfamily protein B1A11.02 n=1 Tax=Cyphellophora attinorum TaxID=1664694 RepID=A0A0N1NXL3_9EURO|nr:AB hydrolase superfamily protein B1A11.02 [Phialophora attinorum]KPI37865.1 AB hydrolase superfamily protein B1A11.02 [Phialophora attinorum]
MDAEKLKLMLQPDYVHPELAEILRTGAPVGSLDESTDIHELRKLLLQRKLEAAKNADQNLSSKETDVQIPTRDGSQITLRIYQPLEKTNARAPVLVMLHGGGWVLGGLENEQPLCQKWVDEFKGVAINVEYRLAPESKFPVPIYDCHDAVIWARSHASDYGGDLTAGFIVAGISAGASMAATVSHLDRDDKNSPPLTGVYLSIPSLMAPEAVPEKYKSKYLSREQHKDGLIINQKAMKLFRDNYQDDPRSPLMSPIIWPSGHNNLPRTYFQIAGSDPLRDEGLIYEQILREDCGIDTKVDLYPGLPHGFWSWFTSAQFSREHFKNAVEGLRWLLGKS